MNENNRVLVYLLIALGLAICGLAISTKLLNSSTRGEFQAVAYDENGFELAAANGYSLKDAEFALSLNLEGLKPAKEKVWKVVKENVG